MSEFDGRRARALHRALWKWMAKHPGCEKCEWPGWKKDDALHNAAASENECFACAASREAYLTTEGDRPVCDYCPIRNKAGQCSRIEGLYFRIMNCESTSRRKELCLQMVEAWPPVENNQL